MLAVGQALNKFIELSLASTSKNCFSQPFEADWTSPCELEQLGIEQLGTEQKGIDTLWRPVPQSPRVNFAGLANAVEMPIHPDIIEFYGSFWSGSLQATWQGDPLSLIQLWNQEDFDRLIENLLGHYLHQKKRKLAFSIFFATVGAESELFISLDNASGEVQLEHPSKGPQRQLADTLSNFITQLSPSLTAPEIY